MINCLITKSSNTLKKRKKRNAVFFFFFLSLSDILLSFFLFQLLQISSFSILFYNHFSFFYNSFFPSFIHFFCSTIWQVLFFFFFFFFFGFLLIITRYCLGFELGSSIPFSTAITITLNVPPQSSWAYVFSISIIIVCSFTRYPNQSFLPAAMWDILPLFSWTKWDILQHLLPTAKWDILPPLSSFNRDKLFHRCCFFNETLCDTLMKLPWANNFIYFHHVA